MMRGMNLLDETHSLLAAASAERSLRSIAMGSNGEIEYDWLKRFFTGEIKDPSVNRVQALHDYLAKIAKRKRSA